MCGIAGWLGRPGWGGDAAVRLTHALKHRGPDAQGVKVWPEATLVHTRLSIIDLSVTGSQPMCNEDGRIWTVFNGEIYNHRELRRDLEVRGHVFRGRSDTEVLPHLYEEEGISFVSKLRGMFALAIYDTKARTLLLARDRFGIKPLFYAPQNHRLTFASEINALRTLPDIDDRPDRQAISDFAALFYIPAPETFFVGIKALKPGEILEAKFDNDRVSWKLSTYHRWSIAPNPDLRFEDVVEEADALVATAVRRQIESDVPLGALLSGGIDSSLVSASAQASMETPLHTFNVRFHEKEYDETWAAVAVANHIGSQHKTLDIVDTPGTWDHIASLLRHAGQPYADTSLFAAHAVCRLMRNHVTVALSGDGGDEGFGGYDLYWQIGRIARWQMLPTQIRRNSAALLDWVSRFGMRTGRLSQRMRTLNKADDTAIIQDLYTWMPEDEHRRLCVDKDLLPVRRFFEPQWEYSLPRGSSRLERLSAHATEVITRLTLPNDFLFKVDTASMKESLEVRVPMLDEDLFAFGLSLPHLFKVNGRTCKQVLRKIAERKLPMAVAKKPKRGFAIPVDTWTDHKFKTQLKEVLLSPGVSLTDFFYREAYRPVIEAFSNGRPCRFLSRAELYQRVVMLLALHLACGRN